MTTRGRFITIEGGEGVGKSSLLSNLARILRARGLDVVVSREPGGTPGADRIRALFAVHDPADPWLPETEALLVSAARAQHVGRLIAPALDRGSWVLCDRFADSTRIYQGALGGMDRVKLESLIDASTGGLTPDLTLLLDCDVAIALERLARPHVDRQDAVRRFDAETREQHEKRRLAYQSLAKDFANRCCLVDASQAPDQVLSDVLEILRTRFPAELLTAGIHPSSETVSVPPAFSAVKKP